MKSLQRKGEKAKEIERVFGCRKGEVARRGAGAHRRKLPYEWIATKTDVVSVFHVCVVRPRRVALILLVAWRLGPLSGIQRHRLRRTQILACWEI